MPKPVILVVDDDVPILTLMRNVLREFGFEARVASSGRAAVQEAREAAALDLILLDKNIPGTLVDETIESLRAAAPHVPILILSGEPVGRSEIAQLGAAGAVMKPFDVVELVDRIRTVVGVAK